MYKQKQPTIRDSKTTYLQTWVTNDEEITEATHSCKVTNQHTDMSSWKQNSKITYKCGNWQQQNYKTAYMHRRLKDEKD